MEAAPGATGSGTTGTGVTMDPNEIGTLPDWIQTSDTYGDPELGAFEGVSPTPTKEGRRIINLFRVVLVCLLTIRMTRITKKGGSRFYSFWI